MDKVLAALPGLEMPNLTGGMAKLLPNHHITKPVYIGEVRGGRAVRRRVEDRRHRAGRRLVGLPAGQQGHRGRLGDAEVRQLQHEDEGVLGTELQVSDRLLGSGPAGSGSGRGAAARRASARAAAAACSRSARAQSHGRRLSRRAGGAARSQLRRQGTDRRAAERERPPERASGARGVPRRSPLRPLAGPEDLHRQVGGREPRRRSSWSIRCRSRTPAPPRATTSTKIGTNNRLRKAAEDDGRALRPVEPGRARCGSAAVKEMLRSLDEASIALLRERVGVETDADVKEEIETGLALAALDSGDREGAPGRRSRRSPARLRPEVRNRLAAHAREIAGRQLRRARRGGQAGRRRRRARRSIGRARSTRASRRCSSA